MKLGILTAALVYTSTLVCLGTTSEEYEAKILIPQIQALCGMDQHERERAILTLKQPSCYRHLAKHSLSLLNCLQDYERSEDSAIILGLLDLPESVSTNLLRSARTPEFVRARLGDLEAERKIISNFNESMRESGNVELAYQLLYVGTQNAILAFAKGMESDAIYTDALGRKVSILQCLLNCYGVVYKEEPLFSAELRRHIFVSEKEFRDAKHQEFLRAIETYFKRRHNVEIKLKARFLIEGKEVIIE